jgi:hypothetical protein
MLLRAPLTLVFAAALLCGCQATPRMAAFIENRNAEARQLEDEYWYQVQENERLAYEVERLKRERAGGAPRRGILGPPGAAPEMPDGLEPPMIEEGLGPPTIEVPGTPLQPDPKRPEIEAEPPPEMPDVLPPPRGAAPAAAIEPEVIDQQVTHLFLNPLHTGGINLDRQPGDDGLSVLLEPRNAANEFVPLAGKISVVLLDPHKSGDSARIARWTFSRGETGPAMSQSGDARGIHLEMPWPARSPENSELRLFVRYETGDGRKVETDREIYVKLPGQFSERWTPRPPERQRRNLPVQSAIVREDAEPRAQGPASHGPVAMAPSSSSAAPLVTPPPALGDSPSQRPSRPQWKPYR